MRDHRAAPSSDVDEAPLTALVIVEVFLWFVLIVFGVAVVLVGIFIGLVAAVMAVTSLF